LVLGLTLAELGILVIFVLLLAFGTMLLARQREIDTLKRALPEERASRRLLSALADGSSDPQAARSLARELIASAVRQDAADEARRRLTAATAAFEKAEAELARGSGTVAARGETGSIHERGEAVRRRIAEVVAERDAVRSTLSDLSAGDRATADRTLATRIENERLKGSMAYASRRLEALGKGSEKPACWATRAGSPEYIFDVGLQSGGISVRDRALPHRRAEQARLPLNGMSYDRVVSGPAFQAMTKQLFEWGEAHGCRFFVLVTDRTGSAEKQRYKTLLLWIEGHFYKYENRST
jgi:hypothetical protein